MRELSFQQQVAIHWFRQDLRLLDNPALSLAAKHEHVLPIYILDDENAGDHAMGAASRFWLHHSLVALKQSLGGKLSIYQGNPMDILADIAKRFAIKAIYWNRCFEPWRINRDKALKAHLIAKGIDSKSANGTLLWEPWNIKKKDGTPYKVFTPFYKKGALQAPPPRVPLPAPRSIIYHRDSAALNSAEQLKLLPTIPWHKKIKTHWQMGETAAHECFQQFIDEGLPQYKEGRNFPAKPYVSRLSPHLHFGEISPNQLWYALRSTGDDEHIEHFCSELGWREFSYSLLYYNPELPYKNLQTKFDEFPWRQDSKQLNAWQRGQTGIPMIDAGMRELWQTGYMHNRVRMLVGSFLVKNLRLHWHHGERWFWDTLLDADLANNSTSWQWIAGCGADAAPYFRIFNPVTQGQKFDPDGHYVREFIPEIAALPNKYLFCPWEAPKAILKEAKISLGKNYPKPIVDLKTSRACALEAFQTLRGV